MSTLLLAGTVTAIAAPESRDLLKTKADSISMQMQEDYRHMMALKERAVKAKDVIKLNCINDKLVQVKARLRIGDAQKLELEYALDKDSAPSVLGQYEATAHEVSRLREDSRACLGEGELFKQESGLTVQRPDIVDDPGVVQPTIIEVEPPAYASPFN
jgi:hypothetical protein